MFEPLKIKEYRYVDAPIKQEPDWQRLYLEAIDQTMQLTGAFKSILANPGKIESVGEELQGYLTLIQENISTQMMWISTERAKK